MNISYAKILMILALTLGAGTVARPAQTNSLVWLADRDQVSADIRGEALWPLLEDIAHQTGWHIFVEPGASHEASVKFRDLRSGVALKKLLGNLNFAFVPRTNGPQELYVFTTTMHNATRRVDASLLKAAPMRHVANHLLVRLKPGADIDALAKVYGAKVVARNDKLRIYDLEFTDAASTDSALASLKVDSNVQSVDYNYIYDAPVMPQPLSEVPKNSGPVSLTLNPNTSTDPCNPIVGLIDSPLQSLGTQLNQLLLKSLTVGSTGSSTVSSSVPTHGTAMAQTILRALAQQGGSTSVRILPVDVYGNSETTTSWNVALGVQAAVDGGATVLNMSLAGTTDEAILRDIIQQALAKGIVIFAAAGNQPVDTPNYPAAQPGVNAVTALGAPGQLAAYANFGSFVSMALPGASVVYLNDQAFVVQGTSPATAYASGLAAATKSINCVPWPQIESAMQAKFKVP